MTRLALIAAPLLTACLSGTFIEPRPEFGTPTAVHSPLDEEGSRFDGARLSPGFGILYRNGYTSELASGAACGGYFTETPSHILEIGYAMPVKLVVQAEGELVMKLMYPNGDVECGAPASPVNENLSLSRAFAPGHYALWIGASARHTSTAYRLVLSE